MNTIATNPTTAVVTGIRTELPGTSYTGSITGIASTAPKTGSGKADEKPGSITNITADSTFSLFPPSPVNFKKLDGEYPATVTAVQLVELPTHESTPGRKPGRKAKNAKRKVAAKAKAPKAGAKQLCLTFTLDDKRADGTDYTVEKNLKPKRDRESIFGEFLKNLLPDADSFNQFFTDYKPARLLSRRCTLKIKESRHQGQSNFKIMGAQPAPAQELTYIGAIGDTVTSSIRETAPVQPVAA